MSGISAELLTVARKVDNYLAPASAWGALNSHEFTVPAGKRWWLYGGIVKRDVSETVSVYLRNGSDEPLLYTMSAGASTNVVHYPDPAVCPIYRPIPMDEGDHILVALGGNQGAGAYLSCIVLEVDI